MEERGQPPLEAWPYNPTLGTATEQPPAAALATDWHNARVIDLPLAHDGVEDLVEDALASSAMVVVVIEVTDELENPGPAGEIATPPLNAAAGDHHAVLVVGAATNSASTLRRLLIHNTWGEAWGASGYGWLPMDYLIAFAIRAGVVDPNSCKSSNQSPAQHTMEV